MKMTLSTESIPTPPAAAPDGLPARVSALFILQQVLQQRRPLDQVLESEPSLQALDSRDRAFVRMLVATVLRRKGQLDDLISKALQKGEEPRPDTLRHILYVGMTQLLFMDVPDHAAVDTAVTLAGQGGLDRQKGFVNAVLRRMTAEGREWLKKQDDLRLNFPDWILQAWIADYGLTEALKIAQASLAEAPLDITVKKAGERKLWASKLESEILPGGSLRRTAGGAVGGLPGLIEGSWWVQDASSALPVRVMGDLKGKKVIDLCAAPGGKTMQLAAAEATVTAVDRSASRIKLLRENLARTALQDRVEIIISDGAEWRPKEPADIVLLDAPCTATGTIRRHPDLLHLKTSRDLQQLTEVQARLLVNAARMVESGGLIVYCTCSLQKDEGEHQIEAFLGNHPDFRRVPIEAGDTGVPDAAITADGDARLLPFHQAAQGGMDGFFIARLRKA